MATKTKAEIKARIEQIKAALATKKKGTPAYAQALANLNKQRGLLGQKPMTAKELNAESVASNNANIADPNLSTTPPGAITPSTPVANAPVAPLATTPPVNPNPVTTDPVTTPLITNETSLKPKVENVIDAQQAAADLAAQQNVQLGTAGTQTNPYGSQTISRDPITGEVKQEVKLSDPQQKILDQGQDLTSQGQRMAKDTLSGIQAGFNPETIARTNTGDLAANRARIEEQVFGRLTRGLEDEKANERQQMEQTLRNRGIPLGSKQFNDQMAQFDKRYDTRIADARAQAAQMGGEEYSRDFGINEQTIANQISQAQTIKNQNLGEAQAYQGMGTGLMTPEFQGYQGTQYQTPDVLGAYSAVTSAQQGKTALEIEREKIAAAQKIGSGGGQATNPTTTNSPFNNTLPS